MISNDQDPAQALAAIVHGTSSPVDIVPLKNDKVAKVESRDDSEKSEKAGRLENILEKILEENKAIKDGLESAKKVTSQSLSALGGISEQLRQVRDLARDSGAADSSAVTRNFSKELSSLSQKIDDFAKLVKVPDVEHSNRQINSQTSIRTSIRTESGSGFTNGHVSSEDLGLSAQGVASPEPSSETEETAAKALADIQLKQAAASSLVSHLEAQLANLDEAIVKGTRALSSITDGNLLMRTSQHSQLDSALHTSVLVQQEALQQNRWVGRALNQLQ
jgi:hypothetical protein